MKLYTQSIKLLVFGYFVASALINQLNNEPLNEHISIHFNNIHFHLLHGASNIEAK